MSEQPGTPGSGPGVGCPADAEYYEVDISIPRKRQADPVRSSRWRVHKRYRILPDRVLGTGAYGVVVAAWDTRNNCYVAIKRMDIGSTFAPFVLARRAMREIKLLLPLDHPNIIKLLDVMKVPSRDDCSTVYLVFEKMDTTLTWVIRSSQDLTSDHLRIFMYQILRGLSYLKSRCVIHRDLKPSNLLVNGNCDVKICDFGLARGAYYAGSDLLADHVMNRTYPIVTIWYRAPELLCRSRNYSYAIDMWAAGCIFAQLLNRQPLFQADREQDLFDQMIKVLGTPTQKDLEDMELEDIPRFLEMLGPPSPPQLMADVFPNAEAEAVELLSKMLVFNPTKRITVEDALEDPFFDSIREEDAGGGGDEENEPIDFSFDEDMTTIEDVKDMIWEELNRLYPELKDEVPGATASVEASAGSSVAPFRRNQEPSSASSASS